MINSTKLDMQIFLSHNTVLYHLHCMKMCSLVSTSASPQGQWIAMLGKNLCWYSPIGACPSIMQVNLAHMEFEIPICGSHKPPLAYVGLMTCSLSSSNSRNSYPFFLLSLNNFCHDSSRESHSFFLLSKNKFFSGRMGRIWDDLASSSTKACLGHFSLLGQYQKCIEFRPSFSRNLCIFSVMEMIDFCRYWLPKVMIFFSASRASVMTRIWCVSEFSNACMRPMHMAINSASTRVMLFVWALSRAMTLLFFQTCAMAVADPDVLTLPSMITAISSYDFWVLSNAKLSFNEWTNKSLSSDDLGEWKTILSEKWSTNCKLGWKIIWKGSNSSLILLSLLLTSLIGLLSFDFCL